MTHGGKVVARNTITEESHRKEREKNKIYRNRVTERYNERRMAVVSVKERERLIKKNIRQVLEYDIKWQKKNERIGVGRLY